MALSGSFSYYPTNDFGLYCEWLGDQNAVENYTAITLEVYLDICNIDVGARNDGIISISGFSDVFTTPAIRDYGDDWHKILVARKTVKVYHNSDGTCMGVSLRASWRFGGTYSGVLIDRLDAGTKVDLDTIDRSAPSVWVSASIVSTSSITIKGSASEKCNCWDYSLDDGSSWINFSTSNGTSASKTLMSLTSKIYSSIKIRARRTDNEVWGISGSTSADITAPDVSFSSGTITPSSVYISAESSVTADSWQYSINNGASWIQFSTTTGTSAVNNITGLTPNTTYQIKVRARKQSNGLYGESAVSSVFTLGATVLNSVSTLIVDEFSPSFNLNWTVYDIRCTHSLAIKNGSNTVLIITGLTGSAGTNNRAISLTSSQKTTILSAMSGIQSFNATFVLTTYSGSMQIGNTSSVIGSIQTTLSASKPTFTDFTYMDVNVATQDVTGSEYLFIQSKSYLQVSCTAATAKNGASIVKYSATIGEETVYSTTTTISFGSISDVGDLSLIVTAIDSRGYETSVTKTITVIDYENITIDSHNIRRENNVEDTIQLNFSGSLSSVTVSGTAKNALVSARYRTKDVSSASWSSYTTISDVESNTTGFSFDNDAWITLPSSNAYYVQIEVADRLSTNTVTLYINKGQPLVSFRAKKVGINTNDPQSALDVNGDIRMNGYNVQGYIGALASESDLNNVLVSGIYYVPPDNTIENCPQINTAAVLEVIEVAPAFLLQRFTCVDGSVYCRGKDNTTWHDWA